MGNRISHSGIVEGIQDGCVKVRIVQTSACAACQVAGHCNAAESKVKIIEVPCRDIAAYRTGQQVVVWASKEVANKALILGFGVPLLLMVAVLMITLHLTSDEGVAAVVSLGSLLPYYFFLWLWRDKIQQQIAFQLEDS